MTVEPMRLQKFLARAGVASRRASEVLIEEGRVSVNGEVLTSLGVKVDPSCDRVAVDGQPVTLPDGKVTIVLHKPAGYMTSMSDPHAEHTVAELVPTDEIPGLFPVGRLDTDTTGLLLFSTDGELGHSLLHPRKHVTKEYVALVEGKLTEEDAARLRKGIRLHDGMTLPADVRILRGEERKRAERLIGFDELASGYAKRHAGRGSRSVLEKEGTYVIVGLREGRKRQVRRMLKEVGHPVIALHRESFGPLSLSPLPRGSWRELSPEEVEDLKRAIDPNE